MKPISYMTFFLSVLLFTQGFLGGNAQAYLSKKQLKKLFGNRTGCIVIHDVQKNKTWNSNNRLCKEALPPCSTFKIPHALIGLQLGIVKDAKAVVKWDGKKRMFKVWNRDQNLRTAIRYSVVWYFQRLAGRIGAKRMKLWLKKIGYGNLDSSGGLKTFWLQSSLKISPLQQLTFLQKLYRETLPISKRNMRLVKTLMILARRKGVVVSGKTGTGISKDRKRRILGWFIGHIKNAKGKSYLFVVNIRGKKRTSGPIAKKIAFSMLKQMRLWPHKKKSK